MLEKLNWFHFTSLLTLVLLIWEWMGLFLRKNHFLRCWSWLFLLKWIGALTLTLLLKLPPKKLEPGLLLKFLSHEVALYLCKSTFCPYLELLDKIQKWICKTVGSSLAAFFQSLAHRQNVASWSVFYRYYFGRCSSELAQLVPLPYSRRRSNRCSDRLHGFSVTICRCYKYV